MISILMGWSASSGINKNAPMAITAMIIISIISMIVEVLNCSAILVILLEVREREGFLSDGLLSSFDPYANTRGDLHAFISGSRSLRRVNAQLKSDQKTAGVRVSDVNPNG